MRDIFIGEIIHQKRAEFNLTQESLCTGLCGPSILSRIEADKQEVPSRNIANALLQRLSLPHDSHYAPDTFLTSYEAETDTLRAEIDSCTTRFPQSMREAQ